MIDEMMAVRLQDIRKAGALVPGSVFWPPKPDYSHHGTVVFTACVGHARIDRWDEDGIFDKSHRVEYVRQDMEPRHMTGYRIYLQCPGTKCTRPNCDHTACYHRTCRIRTTIIYVKFDGEVGCRHCFRALHPSTAEKPHERADNRARKIRDRVAAWAGIEWPYYDTTFPPYPGRMTQRVYNRLAADHAELIERATVGLAAQLGMPYRRQTPPRPLFKVSANRRANQAEQYERQSASITVEAEAEIAAREEAAYARIMRERDAARRQARDAQWPLDPRM